MTAREDRWAALGLDAPPILAPPYRLLNAGLHRVWLSGYGAWTIDRLDARWSRDVTLMPVPAGPLPQRGDIVLWVGTLQYSEDEVREVVFQPSLITRVGRPSHGRVRVESVRDCWLAGIDVRDASDARPGLAKVFAETGRGSCTTVPPSALDMWGLNVWCPGCGHLGTPIAPMPLRVERTRHDEYGNLLPWPQGFELDLTDGDPHEAYGVVCPRCETLWGEPGIAEATIWPEFVQKEKTPFIVGSIADLIEGMTERYGHGQPFRSLDEIVKWLEDGVVDPFDAELELIWDDTIAFRVGYFGYDMRFPFALEEIFWNARELEGDTRAAYKEEALEDAVRDHEGFPIRILEKGGGFGGDYWHTHSYDSYRLPYDYVRKAPNSWTAAHWASTRLFGWTVDVEFEIPLPNRKYSGADASMTLGEIRKAWANATAEG